MSIAVIGAIYVAIGIGCAAVMSVMRWIPRVDLPFATLVWPLWIPLVWERRRTRGIPTQALTLEEDDGVDPGRRR